MLFHRETGGELNACTTCEHHMAISPRERFDALFDGGIYTEVKVPDAVWSIRWTPEEIHLDRIKAAQKAFVGGEKDAMLVAEGEINRTPIVAAAQTPSWPGRWACMSAMRSSRRRSGR